MLLILLVGGAALFLFRPLGGNVGPTPAVRLPAVLEQRGPITILVLGLDRRGTEPARSDTMLLVRTGPLGRPTALLSIPRDLWMTIPGRGEDRVNTAYVWGELDGGAGAALARRTIEQSFGVRVDRVAVFDFACFQQGIDAAGGVTVEVPQRLADPAHPAAGGVAETIVFEPGPQTMSGARALQYVRLRAPDSDFGRIRRQQQVVLALAERLRDPATATRVVEIFLRRCPKSGLDLTAADLAMLGVAAARPGEVQLRLVDESMVTPTTTPAGAQVLVPRWERIRPLVAELFGASHP